MLNIRMTTVDTDLNTTEEEMLSYESWEELEKHFWKGYVRELSQNGHFTIHYHMGGDPRMADTWNGFKRYELVA